MTRSSDSRANRAVSASAGSTRSPGSISSNDDYTQYNGWTINSNELAAVEAGQTWIISSATATHWYRSYPTAPKRSMSIIAKDGLVEIGTTPSFQVHQIKTENDTQYGIIAEPPTYMLPIEDNLGIYVHKTLGQIPLWYDLGIEWSFLPLRDCTPVVMLAGLTFYEHEFPAEARERARS
jgi:hypothetical protein